MKLVAKQLRDIDENDAREKVKNLRRNPLFLVLDNVLDTYNIGGLFRLADALAVSKLYLCGGTETPPNNKILKASVGTYKVVPWEYKATAHEAIEALRKDIKGIQIIAIEQDKKAVDYRKIDYKLPLALVVGNETEGVKRETLALCDHIAEIPMWGINKSLNVIVSAAIVAYQASADFK